MSFGKKLVYFPNFVFTMIRTTLPPNQVAFRVPINLGKIDIRDFLTNLYKVEVKDVRTMNYQGRIAREHHSNRRYRLPSHKKAIVTLAEEFNYPQPPKLEDFGKAQSDRALDAIKRKMKGWRIRPALPRGKDASKSTTDAQ
ncbi:mitochondrial 54S ribosomal protein YmL41 [Entomophthora muscae]|uniref:Mitochondrial 54S ribosomal protein YmL41 n=2 Tax=Entomophthora muscae TaxID=34485 RepID=A0ACC2U444_9FUNG|nr:mitochondrial 54S ribosomal protein YmL41 [Entomophthora muscae]KAJ9086760.1 mitochondrial 54S ribosomal protein YmL41 [Entomophthora muscae]